MRVEKITETDRVAGVSTYTVAGVVEAISLDTKTRAVNDGGVWQQTRALILTTLGTLSEGDRIRVPTVTKTRTGSTKTYKHYTVLHDLTPGSRLGRYEVEQVPE